MEAGNYMYPGGTAFYMYIRCLNWDDLFTEPMYYTLHVHVYLCQTLLLPSMKEFKIEKRILQGGFKKMRTLIHF